MKRAFLAFFAVLSLLVPLTASAGRWVQHEAKWHISQQGGPFGVTAIWVRDTLRWCIASETVDTTAVFSISNSTLPPRGVAPPAVSTQGVPNQTSGTGSDTTTVAWLVFQSDSTGPPTATLSSMTVLLDGRAASTGSAVTMARGWVKVDSALVNGAAGGTLIVGNESVAVPIRSVSPYGSIYRWEHLRARITAATGLLSGGVRVWVRYYTDTE